MKFEESLITKFSLVASIHVPRSTKYETEVADEPAAPVVTVPMETVAAVPALP
jgi:hypothetical protein